VERSVDPALHYVDEDWMGCAGIAFARSTDGGRHLDAPISPPGTVRLVRVTPDVDHAAHIVEVTGDAACERRGADLGKRRLHLRPAQVGDLRGEGAVISSSARRYSSTSGWRTLTRRGTA
jgi:hypothetical protein